MVESYGDAGKSPVFGSHKRGKRRELINNGYTCVSLGVFLTYLKVAGNTDILHVRGRQHQGGETGEGEEEREKHGGE